MNYLNLQDLFHSTTHWLKASGILDKFFDDYMNAEPYEPQPKENVNKPLVNVQLMMLWLIWVSGLAAGTFAFFGELMAEGMTRHLKQITGFVSQGRARLGAFLLDCIVENTQLSPSLTRKPGIQR